MKFTKIVPNVFYKDINDDLKLFVNCLEFTIEHNELGTAKPFCVIEKNGLRISLFENAKLAQEHNPEFRLVTDDIEAAYQKIASTYLEFLHPNLNKITLPPWGAKEFALIDKQLGLIIQQW
ncbi:hypothetical protein G8759_04315 [Spirosoma aureum]|uniref:Glyoxalase n=1 Tax=Spirosoma aureum TaxID=2692134 RepID=A0A6G9AHH3_9BACT|nr:hypothetical protein [Spirosoma aureum]QIP11910.1 hypothetical protein G8759_04315 [Spirosoma aureum]